MSTVCSSGCSAAMKTHLLNLDESALSLFTQHNLITGCQFSHPYILWIHFLWMAGYSSFYNLGKAMPGLEIQSQTFLYSSSADVFWVVQSWIRLWHSRNTTVFYPITQLHDYGHRYLSTSWSLFTAWKWRNRALGHPLWGLWKDWGGIYRKAKTSLWILLILHDQPGAEGTTVQSSTNFSKI